MHIDGRHIGTTAGKNIVVSCRRESRHHLRVRSRKSIPAPASIHVAVGAAERFGHYRRRQALGNSNDFLPPVDHPAKCHTTDRFVRIRAGELITSFQVKFVVAAAKVNQSSFDAPSLKLGFVDFELARHCREKILCSLYPRPDPATVVVTREECCRTVSGDLGIGLPSESTSPP